MGDDRTEELREAARHRGLKLVKSRRRKPGGDFGLFGLTDRAGKRLFGFDDGALTATADDIAAYLRKGSASSWAESARRAKPPARRARAGTSARAPRRPKRSQRDEAPRPPARPAAAAKAPSRPVEEPPDRPPAPPPLEIVKARAADAAAVAALIDGEVDGLKTLLARTVRERMPWFLARQEGVVGCLAWHPIPHPLRGTILRITLLYVAPGERRRGIGTALVAALRDEAGRRGAPIEAISDIAVRNAHGFFRTLDFAQTSYRFLLG